MRHPYAKLRNSARVGLLPTCMIALALLAGSATAIATVGPAAEGATAVGPPISPVVMPGGACLLFYVRGQDGLGAGGSCAPTAGGGAATPAVVTCTAGHTIITAPATAGTISVRVRVRSGRVILVRSFRVGPVQPSPAGVLVIFLSAPPSAVRSVEALDAHGRRLRRAGGLTLRSCAAAPAQLGPGGVITLAHGALPGGGTFALSAEQIQAGGHPYLCLAGVARAPRALGGAASWSSSQTCVAQLPASTPAILSAVGQCTPRPSLLVYGLRLQPGTSVALHVGGRVRQLAERPVPASVAPGAGLFYAFAPEQPSRVVLSDRAGAPLTFYRVSPRPTASRCPAGAGLGMVQAGG